MTTTYVVQAGDWLAKIAREHGTTVLGIWNHPENAGHRDRRASPDILYPGDVLRIDALVLPTNPSAGARAPVIPGEPAPTAAVPAFSPWPYPAFVGLVALCACSAPDMPAETVVVSLTAIEASPVALRGTTAAAAAASTRPEAAIAPLSSEPPEDDMVDVPAGSFWMGCAKGDPDCRDDEKPRHQVTLSAFQIDRLEVTVQQYRTCLRAGACTATDAGQMFPRSHAKDCNMKIPGRDHHGMNCVDGDDALEYCKWLGKRFPTEAEWERAARGTDDRIYPGAVSRRVPPGCVCRPPARSVLSRKGPRLPARSTWAATLPSGYGTPTLRGTIHVRPQ
jgi:hypothetical protein